MSARGILYLPRGRVKKIHRGDTVRVMACLFLFARTMISHGISFQAFTCIKQRVIRGVCTDAAVLLRSLGLNLSEKDLS